MQKARCTSHTLAFKLKVIVEAEAVENNSEIARHYGLVSRWSVAGDVSKESYSTVNWRCLPDERRWAATSQNILSSINSCSSGLRSKEVKVRIHLSCLCFFRWNQNGMNLSRNFLTASDTGNQHFWLVGILRSQNNAVKTKFTFGSLDLYFPQWIKCYCLCRFRYRHGRINVTSESEGTSKWSKASLRWYQKWKRHHSAEQSKLWLNACPMTWKIRSAVSPLHDSSQTANAVSTGENLQHGWDPDAVRATFIANPWVNDQTSVYTFAQLIRE